MNPEHNVSSPPPSSPMYYKIPTDRGIAFHHILTISDWGGRLGNQLIQINHALSTALSSNTPVLFPELLPYLKYNYIIPDKSRPVGSLELCGNFFYGCNSTNQEKRDISQTYILPILEMPSIEQKYQYNSSSTLVIHIRSGDMYELGGLVKDNKGHLYGQPNEKYYDRILQSQTTCWKKIIIVTESDMKNPMIPYIRDTYHAEVISTTEQNDFNILLHCENLVASNSTFSFQPLLLSRVLKKYWHPTFMLSHIPETRMFSGRVQGIELFSIGVE